MKHLDPTQAAIAVRSDELCENLNIDVMALIGYLRASEIILKHQFETPPSQFEIIQFAAVVAQNDKGTDEILEEVPDYEADQNVV